MRSVIFTVMFGLLTGITTLDVEARTVTSQALPIKKVVLYSNGVAYVERRGTVSGDTKIDLSFKQSQIDDVLKSMVVLDLGKGRIGAVSYNSSAPASARLSEIPFSVMPKTDGSTGNGGIAGILSQMQGANVAVTSKGVTTRGSVLNVERMEIRSEKDPKIINTLVLATTNGTIKSFDLKDISGVTLLDEDTKRDLSEFADAAASSRRKDAKTISVTSEGEGRRELLVSYTIASPIWKTTYRVVLDKQGVPFFQGWAIVDNVSDEDWEDVSLSLVSGSPISFVQKLQRPFYKYRPVVPLPTDVNVAPQTYDETPIGAVSKEEVSNLPKSTQTRDLLRLQPGATVAGQRSSSSKFKLDGVDANTVTVGTIETEKSEAIRTGDSGVVVNTTGEDIGELFKYSIDRPMTVKRNRSALIPILQTEMEGERVSVFNESVSRSRPLVGMKLVNTSNLTLEAGSMTVIDGDSYAGEAMIRRLKPKEKRLISFAVDLGTLAKVKSTSDRQTARLIKAFNGVFQVHYFKGQKKRYSFSNQTDKKKVIYVEHPIRNGWKLSERSEQPEYSSLVFHRFRVEVAPFSEKEIVVEEVLPTIDSFGLSNITKGRIEFLVSRNYIDQDTRKRLEALIDIRVKIAALGNRVNQLRGEKRTIAEDQKRIRENIEALAKTPEAKQLIARYINKADSQESRIEEIDKEIKRLESESTTLNQSLSESVRTFTLEKPIE